MEKGGLGRGWLVGVGGPSMYTRGCRGPIHFKFSHSPSILVDMICTIHLIFAFTHLLVIVSHSRLRMAIVMSFTQVAHSSEFIFVSLRDSSLYLQQIQFLTLTFYRTKI